MTVRRNALLWLSITLGVGANGSNAADSSHVWRQGQLNEAYMRSITKHECMLKTIETLKTVCENDDKCIRTSAGLVGDCIEWASGNIGAFCTTFDEKYTTAYCSSGYLNEKHCTLLRVVQTNACRK